MGAIMTQITFERFLTILQSIDRLKHACKGELHLGLYCPMESIKDVTCSMAFYTPKDLEHALQRISKEHPRKEQEPFTERFSPIELNFQIKKKVLSKSVYFVTLTATNRSDPRTNAKHDLRIEYKADFTVDHLADVEKILR
jgi:hypothetical protein